MYNQSHTNVQQSFNIQSSLDTMYVTPRELQSTFNDITQEGKYRNIKRKLMANIRPGNSQN